MDDVRLGNTFRAIRIRKHLRRSDVARRARVSREVISRLKRGGAGVSRVAAVRDIAAALGATVDIRIRWQGADIDRVLNAAHADLHEPVVTFLSSPSGWVWRPEVSFSIDGERGVIDILAWHAESATLLIIELKTELADTTQRLHRGAELLVRSRLGDHKADGKPDKTGAEGESSHLKPSGEHDGAQPLPAPTVRARLTVSSASSDQVLATKPGRREAWPPGASCTGGGQPSHVVSGSRSARS